MNFNKRRTFMFILTIIILFILIFSIFHIYQRKLDAENKSITITNLELGEVGVNNYTNYTKIIMPHSIISNSEFNVTLYFRSNITVKYIYVTTTGFSVLHWGYSYKNYSASGGPQKNFSGTYKPYAISNFFNTANKNESALNVSIKSPDYKYNGIVAIHLVGNVPSNVIY